MPEFFCDDKTLMRAAPRRIVPGTDFPADLAALGSASAEELVRALAAHIAEQPDCGNPLDDTTFRVLHTCSYAEYPALRLYYKYDHAAVYLLAVDHYDELAVAPE
jgi:hypothetical protein